MADTVSKEKRSEIMRAITSSDTGPEMIVRRYLFSKGFRYRLHVKNLPGKPDIVLKKYKSIVLVQGCFWHGHQAAECPISHLPKSNKLYWSQKIRRNQERDKASQKALAQMGWCVEEVWECELRNRKMALDRLTFLEDDLRNRVGSEVK